MKTITKSQLDALGMTETDCERIEELRVALDRNDYRWTTKRAVITASEIFGVPIFYTADKEPFGYCRTYWSDVTNRLERYIVVQGPPDTLETLIVIFHEVGHRQTINAITTHPVIWKEFLAERWCCRFFEAFIPDQYAEALENCQGRMRAACQTWWEMNIMAHPVPQDLADWCGWSPSPDLTCSPDVTCSSCGEAYGPRDVNRDGVCIDCEFGDYQP